MGLPSLALRPQEYLLVEFPFSFLSMLVEKEVGYGISLYLPLGEYAQVTFFLPAWILQQALAEVDQPLFHFSR